MRRWFLAIFLCATAARADWTILQTVESGGPEQSLLVQVQGNHMRVEIPNQLIVLSDSVSGETLQLLPPRKSFTRITAEQSQALQRKALPPTLTAPPPLLATGQNSTLNGYPVQLFTWSASALKMRFYITTAWAEGTQAQEAMDHFQHSGLTAAASTLMPTFAQAPGLRLRTEMEIDGKKWTYTIRAIKQEPLPPERFTVPQGYVEVPFAVEGPQP